MKLSEFLTYHNIKYSDLVLESSSKNKYEDSNCYLHWLKMPININGYPYLVFSRTLTQQVITHAVHLKDARVEITKHGLGLLSPDREYMISSEKLDEIEESLYKALNEERLNDQYLLIGKKNFDITFVNKVDTFYDADNHAGFLKYEQSIDFYIFEIKQEEGDISLFISNIEEVIKYRMFLSATYKSICNQINRDLGDGSHIPPIALMLDLLFGIARKLRIYNLPDLIEEHEYILSYDDAIYDSLDTSADDEEDNGLPELYELAEIVVENFCLNSIEEYHRISLYYPDYCCR